MSESVAEVGFARTTASEIARRAGVTWGAVQHHFGGKDGMLTAVLEGSFNRFAERVESVPREGPLEKRVSLFVDRAWDHYSSADYRTANEILLHFHARDTPPRSRGSAKSFWPATPSRRSRASRACCFSREIPPTRWREI
ncbi:MAG: helix-turn-helix transcriptional regulator [Deltaproteobacteria bacterium]|nr:helix-turn-helix transcriptional regulator [Deltaproteobacteria bacterium]